MHLIFPFFVVVIWDLLCLRNTESCGPSILLHNVSTFETHYMSLALPTDLSSYIYLDSSFRDHITECINLELLNRSSSIAVASVSNQVRFPDPLGKLRQVSRQT